MAFIIPQQIGYLHFTYDGIDNEQYCIVSNAKRVMLPTITDYAVQVPKRPGQYYYGGNYGAREIDVDINIVGADETDLQGKIRAIAQWLDTGEDKPLIFSDEPDKVYYAHLNGATDITQFIRLGQGTLKFICDDPFAYSTQDTVIQAVNDIVQITNNGTMPAYPIIKGTIRAPGTFYAAVMADKYVMLGQPQSVNQAPIKPEELVLDDECGDLAPWQTGGAVDGTDSIAGNVAEYGNYAFNVGSYGTGSGCHGPAIKRSLANPIQDFKVDVLCQVKNTYQGMGKLSIILLDVNGSIVGQLTVGDYWAADAENTVRAMAGRTGSGVKFFETYGLWHGYFNGFQGLIRLERKGNRWHCLFNEMDNYEVFGRLNSRRDEKYWIDTGNVYNAPIAQIEIYFGAYASYPTIIEQVDDIKVYKLNDVNADTQQAQIFQSGDTVEIDCAKACIRKNGEIQMDLLDLGSTFLSLPPGNSEIDIIPQGMADTEVSFQQRWL
jgi:predicted phage tail component-like protein